MKIIRDIEYAQNLKLDVYVPDKVDATFVHFHGGGIVEGDKTDCDQLMEHLANKNILMFNANYSLYPNTKFPEFLYEAAQAVRYAFDHCNEYGGSPKSIYLSGQSAGAYIIMMLALNKRYLESVGINPRDIKGYVSDSGQMIDHFNVQRFELGIDPWLQRISEFSPMYFVDEKVDVSPLLLIYYTNDMLNRKEQNLMLYNLIKHYNKDIDVTHLELKGGHVDGSCKLNSDNEYPYVKELVKWLHR